MRRLEFTEAVRVSLLSERRRTAPFGLAGGLPGATGEALLRTAAGEEVQGGRFTRDLAAGDVLEIRTPGGGGFGKPVEFL